MKKRISRKAEPTRVGSVKVTAIRFKSVTPLITLDDPGAPLEPVRNAFARLRPPDDLTGPETASWRNSAAAIAIAVQVKARPRRNSVPLTAIRDEKPAEGIREEVMNLARETEDKDVIVLVERLLIEAEASG